MGQTLKVDSDKCAGHGRCYSLAPGLMDSDDAGYPIVRVGVVPADLLEDADEAVRNCPEQAITLV